MSMMLKFILFAFIITTYVMVNPSVTCHNDCEVIFKGPLYPSTHTGPLITANEQQVPKAASLIKAEPNDKLSFIDQHNKLPAPHYSLAHDKAQQNIVEGGTGKIGDTRKLFEFNNEPLTPQQEIQKQGEEEDGIEGTGRMALGNEHLIAYGPISRFGSIYVNGIRYQVSQAQMEFVNEPALSQLSVGMMVKIQADWHSQNNRSFNAQKVWFDLQLKGPVTAIASTSLGAQLTILGTQVNINEDTVLENLALKNIKPDHVLAISGIADTDGSLLATHISRRSLTLNANQVLEIESKVLSVNTAQQRISINGIELHTDNAKWKNTSIQALKSGDTIEVLGHYDNANSRLNAISIKLKKANLSLINGTKLSVDGIINLYQSDQNFFINGQKSNAGNAEFLGGDGSTLNNRVRIKANGRIDQDGVFIIRTVEIIRPTNASIKATVISINPNSGEIALLGVNGYTKQGTLFQSKLASSNKYFNINDISPGDWVELKGKWSENKFNLNAVNAINPQKKQVLKGQIEIDENGKISILGIQLLANTLLTDEQTSNLESGDFVLAKGQMLDADTFNADSLTLE